MSKRRGRGRRRSGRRARITFQCEPAQENLTGRPTWLLWAAMAGVLLFGVALVVGLSVASVSTHADSQAGVDVRLDGSWSDQGEFADPTQPSANDTLLNGQVPTVQSDGDDDFNDWLLTTLGKKYYVPTRRRVPGRSREVEVPGDGEKRYSEELTSEDVHVHTDQNVGDGVPDWDMDGDDQDAPGVSTALPGGDLDGLNVDWEKHINAIRIRRRGGSSVDGEKKEGDKHLNGKSDDEKQPTSAMTSGNNRSTDMSAQDDSSLQKGNDDLVRDEEGTSAVDAMTLENSDIHLNSTLAENLNNHDKNHHVRRLVKNTDKIVVIVVGTVVAVTVVHQCMTQTPLGV